MIANCNGFFPPIGSDPVRVIFLTHNYPRWPGDLPGGFLHPLAQALRGLGADVRVVAPADQGRVGEDEIDGVPVRRVRYAPAAWEWLAYTGRMAEALRDPRGWVALAGLCRALRQGARAEASGGGRETVVHAHWWFPAGAAAPPELPLVITLHGTDGRLLESSGIGRTLGRRVLRRARVVSAVSATLARVAQNASGRLIVADAVQPMPIDGAGFRRTTGGGGVVSVARLTPQKRLHLLIEAAAVLHRDGRPIPVTIAGEGPERRRLEALIARLNLGDWIRLPGALPAPAVADLLATADLFILPAIAEGYGLAAAEALLSGVPIVVCRDGGGLTDLLADPAAGRAVPPDPTALAGAAADLLDDRGAADAAWRSGEHLRVTLDPAAVAGRALAWYRNALIAAG